jgi:hypothetical protein
LLAVVDRFRPGIYVDKENAGGRLGSVSIGVDGQLFVRDGALKVGVGGREPRGVPGKLKPTRSGSLGGFAQTLKFPPNSQEFQGKPSGSCTFDSEQFDDAPTATYCFRRTVDTPPN